MKGLNEEEARRIEAAVRREGPFESIAALRRSSGASVSTLRRLAKADAFGSMGLDRQRALWQVRSLREESLPLFDGVVDGRDRTSDATTITLPPVAPPRQVMEDYDSLRLSLKAHPVAFLRRRLDGLRATPAAELADETRSPNGRFVRVAGIVLIRQRPSTAQGIIFMTLEDETGIANLIVRPAIYERYRKAARHGVIVLAEGTVERQGRVVHVLAKRLRELDGEMRELVTRSRDFR